MPSTMFSREGQRKYLTREETTAFLQTARSREPDVFAFCWVMAATGCRISEALALTPKSIDFAAQHLVIECLKKRGKVVFRAIPLPSMLLAQLRQWIPIDAPPAGRLWPWSRMTGYRRICEVMIAAGVKGVHASPKGLRHGFGVGAIQAQIPLNLVQRWLGHADMKTTAIYTSVIGPEERSIAERMWDEVGATAPAAETMIAPPDRTGPSPVDRAAIPFENPEKSESYPTNNSIRRASTKVRSFVGCMLRHYWIKCNKNYCANSDT